MESLFVFPITFFVVFFMIMAGEGMYQEARVERILTNAGIEGAARIENPMLDTVVKSGVPTSPTACEVRPYRYIFTDDADDIADNTKKELETSVNGLTALFFQNMAPSKVTVDAKADVNPLISHLRVECSFEVPFPIRMIFTNEEMSMPFNLKMSGVVSDPSELVRVVGYVMDLIERSEGATNLAGKGKDILGSIGSFIN